MMDWIDICPCCGSEVDIYYRDCNVYHCTACGEYLREDELIYEEIED